MPLLLGELVFSYRCLDMKYSPLAGENDAPHHVISEYNTVFMELKMLIIGKTCAALLL